MNSFTFARVVPGVVLGRVQHGDAVGDELQHVLVARDDDDFAAGLGGLPAEGADDVVRFKAGVLEDGDAQGVEQAADVGDLLSRSGGVSVRLALYSANSSPRWVLPRLSKTAAMYCGSKVLPSFRSMLLKMKTASVEIPVVVRMGGAPVRARA